MTPPTATVAVVVDGGCHHLDGGDDGFFELKKKKEEKMTDFTYLMRIEPLKITHFLPLQCTPATPLLPITTSLHLFFSRFFSSRLYTRRAHILHLVLGFGLLDSKV